MRGDVSVRILLAGFVHTARQGHAIDALTIKLAINVRRPTSDVHAFVSAAIS